MKLDRSARLLACAFLVAACQNGRSSPEPAGSTTTVSPSLRADEMQQAMIAALDASASENRGAVQLGGATSTVYIPDLQRVVVGHRSRMRACYRDGLKSDAAMRGKLVIALQVNPKGEVTRSEVATNQGLPDAVATCIAQDLERAVFGPPGGVGATVKVPLDLVP